jgi:hypothetical protein
MWEKAKVEGVLRVTCSVFGLPDPAIRAILPPTRRYALHDGEGREESTPPDDLGRALSPDLGELLQSVPTPDL